MYSIVPLPWPGASPTRRSLTPTPSRILLPDLEAIVPALWHLEVANAFLMGERRGRNTPADTGRWSSFLASLPITIDDQTMARAWSDITKLARVRSLTSYDAAYIELALRRGFPMATLDAKLKAAAMAAGVPIFQVVR